MALTLSDLRSRVSHALHGGDPNAVYTDANTTKDQIINEAGRFLFTSHPWSWKLRPAMTVNVLASQEYADLPVDFGKLVNVLAVDGLNRQVDITTLSQMEMVRSENVTTSQVYFAAVAWPTQLSKSKAPPPPRLQIYPASDDDTTFRVVYKAKWVELVQTTDVPNVPVEFESLLVRYVDAFAKRQDDENFEAEEFLLNSTYFKKMVEHDSSVQWDHGRVQGGYMQAMRRPEIFADSLTVADPS